MADPLSVEAALLAEQPDGSTERLLANADRALTVATNGSVLDPGNSSTTALAADEEVFGDWIDTESVSSLLPFAFGLVALDTIELQWSTDGVTPNTDLLGTTDLTATESETSGFFIYLGNPLTTMIARYVRVHIVNGPDAQTAGFYSHALWRYHSGSYPFTFTTLDSTLSALSSALLTRSVISGQQPDGDLVNVRADGLVAQFSGDLDADEVVTLGPFDTDGWRLIQVTAVASEASADPGVLIEYLDDVQAVTPIVTGEATATVSADDAAEGFMTVPFQVRNDGFQVTYTNGPVPVAGFEFLVDLRVAPIPATRSNKATIDDLTQMTLVRSTLSARADDGTYPQLDQTDGALHARVTEVASEVDIASLPDWDTKTFNVSSDSPTVVDLSLGDRARSLLMFNSGTGLVYVAPTAAKVQVASQRFPIPPQFGIPWEVKGPQSPAFLAADLGGVTFDTNLNGTTTQNNAGVVTPDNLLTADDARALFDTTGDTVEVTGFTATRAGIEVATVELKAELRKDPAAPASQQATFVDVVTATAGNVGSIDSPIVTSDEDHCYLAWITRRNGSAAVNSVIGLGLTWEVVADATNAGGSNRLSVWKATGTPTGDGAVQAIFSTTATNCTIGVARFSGALDVDQFETLQGSGSSYSDSLAGTDKGNLVVFATSARRTHVPGSSSTERADFGTGTGPNDSRSVMTTRQLAATGAAAYSGTWSASADWALVAVTLTPSPSIDPEVTITYDVGGTPGTSSLVATATSTTDTPYTAAVTGDIAWTFNDVDDVTLQVTATDVGVAPVQVDRVWLHVVEAEAGNTQSVSILEVGTA